MSFELTERAKSYIQGRISVQSELVPLLAWTTATFIPTGSQFSNQEEPEREGWWLFFSSPGHRPQEWMVDVGGVSLSVSPDMQDRLEGKTLDFIDGHLREI